MDEEFLKTFRAAIAEQKLQNAAARKEMEDFLAGLRTKTEDLVAAGQRNPARVPQNWRPTSHDKQASSVPLDWVRLVIQAATLDDTFTEETRARAARIVEAATTPETGDVSPTTDPG
jgi:hypothetical protein